MATTDLLAERYGTPAPWRRRALIAAIVVVALAFAGWLGWTIWEQSRPEVSSQLVGYTVNGPGSATARVQIDQDGDAQATCTLQAYATDHTLVGQLDFQPDPGTTSGNTYTVTINTEREATQVQLIGCTAPGQSRPR